MRKSITVEIKQLPSGYWSIWINGDWIDASCATELEAKRKLYNWLKDKADKLRDERIKRMEMEG